MNEQAVLYALSTLAQTCAALAALVGALGLYRIQALREEQQRVETIVRSLVVPTRVTAQNAGIVPIDDVIERARAMVRAPNADETTKAPRMQQELAKRSAFDPSVRRAGRLLVMFELWNLLVIFIALAGFSIVPHLEKRWWTSVGLWILTIGTVVATGLMLLEMHGSLHRRLRVIGLEGVVTWLERGPRPEPLEGWRP